MNKDIKQLAEETLDSISKVNGFSDFGGIVLDYDLHYTTIATLKDVITVAMVEMYTAGAGEATCSLPLAPTDDEIETNGKEGGLRDGELQLFWEGAVWMRSKAKWQQCDNVATTTPLSSSSGDAPFNSSNNYHQ
jgi:hypothetical protein